MPLVKVWNDHTQPHTEEFEAVTVQPPTACVEDKPSGRYFLTVPAKGYVEMEWEEGVRFASKFHPIKRDGLGNYLTVKMIRVEQPKTDDKKQQSFKCQACKEEFQTEKSLTLHSEAEHANIMVDEDALKTANARKK